MKKVLFLMFLLFLGLGTANVKAQVRIGGNAAPQGAAVLDLNTDNSATPATNKGALALPRISLGALSGALANLNGTTPINGMLVYNTNTTTPLVAGIYVWSGTTWIPVTTGSSSALTDTLSGGGLTRTGSLVGIKASGVTTGMIANGSVTLNKLQTTKADSGRVMYSNGTNWVAAYATGSAKGNIDTVNQTLPTTTVTWTKVLDTTWTTPIALTPLDYANIRATSVRAGDLCFTAGTYLISDVAGNQIISVQNTGGGTAAVGTKYPIRCYHPSY